MQHTAPGVFRYSLFTHRTQGPIVKSKRTDTYEATSLWACVKCVPTSFLFRGHPVTLAFAVTDYKLQGKTLDELILSIAPRPFLPHLDMRGFYTMTSPVRTRGRLRVLRRPLKRKGGLDSLFKLKHTPELAAWNAGYNEAGDWDPSRPQPAAVVTAKAKAAPAKRRAKAKVTPAKRSMAKNSPGA